MAVAQQSTVDNLSVECQLASFLRKPKRLIWCLWFVCFPLLLGRRRSLFDASHRQPWTTGSVPEVKRTTQPAFRAWPTSMWTSAWDEQTRGRYRSILVKDARVEATTAAGPVPSTHKLKLLRKTGRVNTGRAKYYGIYGTEKTRQKLVA
jgi:hypothetical protein